MPIKTPVRLDPTGRSIYDANGCPVADCASESVAAHLIELLNDPGFWGRTAARLSIENQRLREQVAELRAQMERLR